MAVHIYYGSISITDRKKREKEIDAITPKFYRNGQKKRIQVISFWVISIFSKWKMIR